MADSRAAAGAAAAILGIADDWMSTKAIAALLPERMRATVSQSISSLVKTKRMLRRDKQGVRESRRNPDFQKTLKDGDRRRTTAKAKAPVAIAISADNFTSSFGTTCTKVKARIDADRQQELLDLFDGDDCVYDFEQLAGYLPDWDRLEIAKRLSTAIKTGALRTRYSPDQKANLYWQGGASSAPTHLPDIASVDTVAPVPAKPASPPLPKLPQADLGLRARLDAVCTDLEDLVADACDGQLPHALIKWLSTATGAAQRAARQMVG